MLPKSLPFKNVTLPFKKKRSWYTCSTCNGKGYELMNRECKLCNGHGCMDCEYVGYYPQELTCLDCAGTGYVEGAGEGDV